MIKSRKQAQEIRISWVIYQVQGHKSCEWLGETYKTHTKLPWIIQREKKVPKSMQ